jgi:cysteine synthase A
MVARIVDSVLDLIGCTPLVKIKSEPENRAEIWAKLEQQNPGGSVKDRIALAMIETAEKTGDLQPGGVVIEPTSGNTGIGLAMVCAIKNYRCILTMPESMSLERRQLLQAFGAEIVLTPEREQMTGAVARAKTLAKTTPNSFMPSQFDNPANPEVHAEKTAREILEAMGDLSIDAFVATIGTGGTISGVGRALKQAENKGIRIIAVEPDACAMISRGERGPTKIQGLAPGFIPKNYDASTVDEVRTVTDADAWRRKVELAHHEGLLVGISSGAAFHTALEIARELGPGRNVVTILPDTGERYFSLEDYFSDAPADVSVDA